MEHRLVITGMGTINPLGHDVEKTWQRIVEGKSGVGPISLFDASRLEVRIACEVKSFNAEEYMSAKEARRRDRFEQFAIVAANEAIQQAGLHGAYAPERVGVVISSAIGGLNALVDTFHTLETTGPRRISPFAIPMLMSNGAAGLVAIEHGFQGPALSINSACASGIDAIGMAWSMLKSGWLDAVVTGASEATITEIGIATFDRLGALSKCNDDYATTPRPFDLNRDGLVIGEGAAVIIMEREETARRRDAPIFAEIAGYASTADAYHITAPDEDGVGGARAMREAMKRANVSVSEVDYINAHGTATQLNDLSETRAIKRVFGERAGKIPVSSTKSMTGHLMGATGALETIFCTLAIRDHVIPPTINYQTPDPQCDLDYVPNQRRHADVHVAMNNAFGFGGHNAVLIVRSVEE